MGNPEEPRTGDGVTTIQEAVQAIAGVCDGAVEEDGVGFNGTDSHFGKALASSPNWTPKMEWAAWHMMIKYRRQLTGHNIDFDNIPKPPDPETLPPPPDDPKTITVETIDAEPFGPDVPLAAIRSPYDADLVALMRDLPGRRWIADRKLNVVPLTKPEAVTAVLNFGAANGFDVDPEVMKFRAAAEAAIEEAAATERKLENLSAAMDSDPVAIPGLVGTLRPYQHAAVRYISNSRRCFLADEMGTGKTVMTLAALEYEQAFPALIVVPAVAKPVWRRHVEEWLPERTAEVLSGAKPPEGWSMTADVAIINYDILSGWADRFPPLTALVMDESHYVKNGKAQRTQHCTAIAHSIPDDGLVLCLTGTPVTNRPSELVAPLKMLGQLKPLGGWYKFVTKYCGGYKDHYGRWDVSGATNTAELNAELKKRCYMRRTKRDVLPDLPPKTWAVIPLNDHPAGPLAEYREAERNVVKHLVARAVEIAKELGTDPATAAVEQRLRAEAALHLVSINTLRQLAVNVKMEAVKKWVTDFLEGSDQKLVIFAHHRNAVKALAEEFNAPTISGGDSDREHVVARFQTDPECRMIVCSIKASGVALTLTAASNVLFVEQDWTPAGMDQAADRVHRIGQDEPVTAWVTMATGTVDEMMANLLAEKRHIINAVVDGADIDTSSKGMLGDMVVALARA